MFLAKMGMAGFQGDREDKLSCSKLSFEHLSIGCSAVASCRSAIATYRAEWPLGFGELSQSKCEGSLRRVNV